MADAAAKEPSMDDILSSIRKIIAEEGHTSETAAKPAEEPSSVKQSEEARKNSAEEVFNEAPPQTTSQATPQSSPQATPQASAPPPQPKVVEAEFAPQPQQNAAAPDMKTIAALMDTPSQQAQPHVAQPHAVQAQVTQQQQPTAQMERVEMAQATKAPVTPFVASTPSPDPYQGDNRRTDPPMAEHSSPAVPVEQVPASVEEVSSFKGALMSPSADSAVSSAFDRLKRSTQDDLDATTEALLRPMLREWLDENLPTMVERLIREEIERVARGV